MMTRRQEQGDDDEGEATTGVKKSCNNKPVADTLACNSALTTLVMDKCALGPDGATRLADALAANASLATLLLEGNMIGPKGGEQLFRALDSNSALERLGLRMNRIGSGGDKADVRALEEALARGRCRLASLGLAYNDLWCSGCAVLSRAITSER